MPAPQRSRPESHLRPRPEGGGRWWWLRARRFDETGSSAVEFVITTPVVTLLIFGIFQGALYFHARSVIESAAEQGTAAARRFDGSAGEGQSATREYLDQQASEQLLQDRRVRVTRGGTTVQTTVSGQVVSLLPVPFIRLNVSATSSGPVERYVPPAGDPR